jgi:hypothetical protein
MLFRTPATTKRGYTEPRKSIIYWHLPSPFHTTRNQTLCRQAKYCSDWKLATA